MKTFIYTLRREDSLDIRYIGKTINLKKRFREHTSYSGLKSKTNIHFKNWILKSKREGVKIIIEIIDIVDTNGSNEEIYWISQFKTWGFNLLNMTEGGDGFLKNHTEETKLKISVINKGRKRSEATKKLMSKNRMGFKLSQKTKDKISKAHKGKKYSKLRKLLHHRKPVICIEDNKKFDYITEAAKYYNVSISSIHNQIKGLSKKLRNGKTFKYDE